MNLRLIFCVLALAACNSAGGGNGGGSDLASSDGGASDDAALPDYDAFGTPTTCTSGRMWTLGDRGSPIMHPGGACIDCHSNVGGPSLLVAGTVFPTAHEPTDCDGVGPTGYTVVVTQADGTNLTLSVNSAGNFYQAGFSIAFPITAKVVSPTGAERAMTTPQMSADCNSCHTVDGANGAPGRIVAP